MQEGCVFCEIIEGRRKATILHRDDRVVVFRDIRPAAPVHLLIVPVKHIRSINDITEEDGDILADMILTARSMARNLAIDSSGYKLLFNVERGAGQVVFHVHLHLIGGWDRS